MVNQIKRELPGKKTIINRGYIHTLEELEAIRDRIVAINPDQAEEICRHVRRQVYSMGLGGGYETIKENAERSACHEQRDDGLTDPIHQETGIEYEERVRTWQNLFAFRALSIESQTKQDEIIGGTNARYRTIPQPERIKDIFFNENGEYSKKYLDPENLPLDIALDLVALSETPEMINEFEGQQQTVIKAMATMAHVRLISQLITIDPQYIDVGKNYLKYKHYKSILNQSPGDLGEGEIGRKAAGMMLAYAILETEIPEYENEFTSKFSPSQLKKWKEFSQEALKQNNSYFIGSKVFHELIRNNKELYELPIDKYIYHTSKENYDYETVKNNIHNAKFPHYIEKHLRDFYEMIIKKFNGKPFIVRSSSELEDQDEASFAGMYDSFICSTHVINPDYNEAFDEFMEAIKKIYASVFSPEVLEYRFNHKLIDFDEEMGLLVQELNGHWHSDYFFPDFAGVCLSHSQISLAPDPCQGQATIVTGLGDLAVEKAGKNIWFDKPSYNPKGANPYFQQSLYVVDRNDGKFKLIPISAFLESISNKNINDPYLRYSLPEIMQLADGSSISSVFKPEDTNKMIPNFNNIAKGKFNLPLLLHYYTKKLEYALGYKVELEFTAQKTSHNNYCVQIVQCRPQNISEDLQPTSVPNNVSNEQILLDTSLNLSCGKATNIRYIVYLDPDCYGSDAEDVLSFEEIRSLNQYIRTINENMGKKEYMVIAPGRWGNNRLSEQGLSVKFGDYSKTAGVCEVTGQGYWEEIPPSAGSHDHHLCSEAGILFLSLDAGNEDNKFRSAILQNASNKLQTIMDGTSVPKKVLKWLKVIDVEELGKKQKIKNARIHIAMKNGKNAKATIYIAPKDQNLPESVKV